MIMGCLYWILVFALVIIFMVFAVEFILPVLFLVFIIWVCAWGIGEAFRDVRRNER